MMRRRRFNPALPNSGYRGVSADSIRRGVTHVDLPGYEWSPEQLLRLGRLGRELRLTDQILSVDLDTVSIVLDGPAPAWTSLEGDHITFSMRQMPFPRERVDVAVWLGTNGHELGHNLFSPRGDSMLMRRVIEAEKLQFPGIAMMANLVEDQRMERLLLAMFSPWRAYLVAALGHHLVASDEMWLLVAGRTWLPDDVRAQAYARMVATHGRSVADLVTQLIDDYQRLLDPGDDESDEAWRILTELHNLFELNQPQGFPKPCTVRGEGEPMTGEPGDGAPETATEKPCNPEGSGGDGEPTGEGKGDQPSDQDDGESESSQSSGAGAGSKPSASKPPTDTAKVRKQMRDAASKELAEADDTDDLDSVMDALRHGRAGDQVSGLDAEGRYVPATDAARRLYREVADALLDLKDAAEPGWVKRVDSGRLNIRRLLDPSCPADEIFDRYEPGQMDSSELDVILVVDISGSMGSQMFNLAESVWAIRRAVDDLEGRCTVIAFESGPHEVVNQPGDRPDDRLFVMGSKGGTEPSSALRESYQLLAGSPAKNRIVMILTDGDWSSPQLGEGVVRALNEAGVITVMITLASPYMAGRSSDHGCRYGAIIDALPEMARLFRRVAAEQIGQW